MEAVRVLVVELKAEVDAKDKVREGRRGERMKQLEVGMKAVKLYPGC